MKIKTIKIILRFLIISHIFPVISLILAIQSNPIKPYLYGWGINILLLLLILLVRIFIWIFEDDNYDRF